MQVLSELRHIAHMLPRRLCTGCPSHTVSLFQALGATTCAGCHNSGQALQRPPAWAFVTPGVQVPSVCTYICKTARAMSVLRIHSQTSTRLHTSSGNQRSALHDSAANSKRYVCTWSNCPKWAKCTFGTCMSDGFRMHPTCTLLTAPRM